MDVSFLQCSVGGKLFPSSPLTPDFTTSEGTLEIYLSLLECCRIFTSGDVELTYSRWLNGSCLIPICLANHLPSLSYSQPTIEGDLIARVRFKQALTEAVNIYAFTISPTTIKINSHRSVELQTFIA